MSDILQDWEDFRTASYLCTGLEDTCLHCWAVRRIETLAHEVSRLREEADQAAVQIRFWMENSQKAVERAQWLEAALLAEKRGGASTR